ncbi:hypothetical protein ABPG72_011936 [Tetrahymena utriculariae]
MSKPQDNQLSDQSMEIYCQTHKDKIIFLSYRDQNQQPEIEMECQTCRASKQKQADWIYIVLSQIIQNKQNEIIYGFPPFKDDQFLKAYYEKLNYNQQKQLESYQQIKQKFQATKQEIIQKLENIERNFFKQFDDQISQTLSYQNEIYLLQQRDELIKLISGDLTVDKNLQDFFKTQFENLENKEAILREKISQYQKLIDQGMNFNNINSKMQYLDQVNKNILSFIESKEDKMDNMDVPNHSNINIFNNEEKKNTQKYNQEVEVINNLRYPNENENIIKNSEQIPQQLSLINNEYQNDKENQYEFNEEERNQQKNNSNKEFKEVKQNNKENEIDNQEQIQKVKDAQIPDNDFNDEQRNYNSSVLHYEVNAYDDDDEKVNEDTNNNEDGQFYLKDFQVEQKINQIKQVEIIQKIDIKDQINTFINKCNEYLQNILENCQYKGFKEVNIKQKLPITFKLNSYIHSIRQNMRDSSSQFQFLKTRDRREQSKIQKPKIFNENLLNKYQTDEHRMNQDDQGEVD